MAIPPAKAGGNSKRENKKVKFFKRTNDEVERINTKFELPHALACGIRSEKSNRL